MFGKRAALKCLYFDFAFEDILTCCTASLCACVKILIRTRREEVLVTAQVLTSSYFSAQGQVASGAVCASGRRARWVTSTLTQIFFCALPSETFITVYVRIALSSALRAGLWVCCQVIQIQK